MVTARRAGAVPVALLLSACGLALDLDPASTEARCSGSGCDGGGSDDARSDGSAPGEAGSRGDGSVAGDGHGDGQVHGGGEGGDGSTTDGGVPTDAGEPDAAHADGGAFPLYVASNVPDRSWWSRGNGSLVTGGNCVCWLMDTDTGQIWGPGTTNNRPAGRGLDANTGIYFEVISQGGDDPDLGVFVLGSLEVPEEEYLFVAGENALLLLVNGSVRVAGSIESGFGLQSSGGFPGGEPRTTAPGRGAGGGAEGSSGGGGGGFGGPGGHGGDPAAAAGQPFGSARLVPLVGGGGGGGGGGASGGVGGDAYQISAAETLTVTPEGRVDVGGRGGRGAANGGGGGGAGGAILLEAPEVTIDGVLAANGGGGGCAGGGEYGRQDDEPAVGGTCSSTGAAGAGAAGSTLEGGPGTGPGGGGGGAGRIHIRSAGGLVGGAGTFSPDATTGAYTVGTL